LQKTILKTTENFSCDFIIEVEEGRDVIVLQLTDPQIIDSAQARYESRLSVEEKTYWATENIEKRCYRYIRETIKKVKPDLILITGDLVYGEFDDKGTALLSFIDFMEGFKIPWAPIFGNHDNDTAKGVDWQCQQLINAEYCLFNKGETTGNGNYIVGIMQGGELKRIFVMLDTHGWCRAAGLTMEQVDWFTKQVMKIVNEEPNVKISFVMHIQPMIFKVAYQKYGFNNFQTSSNPIDIDKISIANKVDFGYIGNDLKTPWDFDYSIWKIIKGMGCDSIFVGHEHANNASVMYDGVRFQYGQKSSTYDRVNYVNNAGERVCSFLENGKPLVGGTVICLSAIDGKISGGYIYLCDK
jgi:hypothetical protein